MSPFDKYNENPPFIALIISSLEASPVSMIALIFGSIPLILSKSSVPLISGITWSNIATFTFACAINSSNLLGSTNGCTFRPV